MRVKHLLVLSVCAALVCGCAERTELSEDKEFSKLVFAMDTEMLIKAYGDNAETAVNAAEQEINRLDKLFDRGREGSDVYRVNRDGSAELSDDTAELTERALEICRKTDGAFDITIAPVMDLWGFCSDEYNVPDSDELEAALAGVDYRNVSVRADTVTASNGARIDLGGIAKGYLSARIMDIFKENGVSSGIVSLGGNVQTLGTKPGGSDWRVAIQSPFDSDGYIGSISIHDMAVITSGGYQRYFEYDGVTYHHIINPSTGYPAQSGLSSVTVVCEDGTLADGLSTALFVMGLERGTEYWRAHSGFDVIFVTDDGDVHITEGLDGSFAADSGYDTIRK